MANQTLKPFNGELDPVDGTPAGLKPFTGTLDGEKPQRTLAQAAKDTVAQLAEGVNTTLGAIPSVVAPQSRAAGFFRDNAQYWNDQQSDVLKNRIAESDKRIEEAGKDGLLSQIGTAASEYWNDPSQAARLVATNLPSMAATLGTGAAASLAARGVAAARGLDAASKAALAAKYGTTTAAATNAVLNAGGARGEAFGDLQKAALAQGMTPEQAEQAGVTGSILPGVVGGAAGALSGKIGLEKAILGQATTGAAMRKAAGAFGAEMAGEQIEELAPKVATNYQVGQIDPARGLTDGLGRTMVETAIGSGPGAIVAGGAAGLRGGDAPANTPPAQDEFTTSPGAADPNAPSRPQATPPEAPDLTTSPGAGVARDGIDFTRDVDTSGLSLQDPAELARQRAATVDYQPGDTTPQWDTQPGAAPARNGLDMPAPEFDTGSLGIDNRTPSERMGLDPARGSLTRAAALAVDTGASPVQFLGATGRDMQLRQTGPGVANESNVIDVQGRVIEDRAIATPRRLAEQRDGMAARALGGDIAAQPPANRGSVPALPAPTNLRDAIARIRAQRQEAANAQGATPETAPSSAPVPAAGTGAVEAAGLPPRGREGYDTPVTLDAASLKALVEKTRGTPLVDKPEKLEAWRNGTAKTDPAKFPIELAITPDGRLDVNDGRHRIALAAERGETVEAFIDGKDAQYAQQLVSQPSQPQGAASVATPDQAQQASPQPAQAAAAPAAGPAPTNTAAPAPAGASTVRALSNGATTQNLGAQTAPAAGTQAAPQAEDPAQRVARTGDAWTRMPTVERQALAQRADLKPIVRKNVHRAAWADLNRDVQRKLAEAMGGRVEAGGNQTRPGTQQAQAQSQGAADQSSQIAEAVSKADRLDLKGAERAQWVKDSLAGAWGMTADEVGDMPEVAAGLRKKPSKEDATAATVRRVEQVLRQAEKAAAINSKEDAPYEATSSRVAKEAKPSENRFVVKDDITGSRVEWQALSPAGDWTVQTTFDNMEAATEAVASLGIDPASVSVWDSAWNAKAKRFTPAKKREFDWQGSEPQLQAAAETVASNSAGQDDGVVSVPPVIEAAQLQAATHTDPGEKAEAATPAVVTDSLKKAARNEDTKPSEMRKWLVGKIDDAIAVAPEAAVDFLSFDVPGDGTFKVQNSQARLQEFRKKVMASPGFKDGGQKQNTKPPEQVDSAINGSGSTVEALRNFLADGDVQGAIEFAKLKGVEFTPVPPQMKMSADGKGKVKHMPASVKSSVPSVAEGLTQVEAEQINQYLTAESARKEPAATQDAVVQPSPQDFIPAPASASPESESSQGSSNARGQDASAPPTTPEVKADDVEPKIMQSRPNDWPYANYGWVMVGGGRNAPGAASEKGAKIELSKNPEWKERGAVILPFRWNDGGLRGLSPYAETTTRYAILVRQKESPRIEASSETSTPPAAQPITRADVTAAQQQAGDGITIKPGKGLIKGKFLAEVDGDGVPGGPWDTEQKARTAAEAWKQTTADRATEDAAERARRGRIADKFRAGEVVTNAEIESLGLKTGSSDMRWFMSTAANLFGLNSRDIRPLVKDLIRTSLTDMGAKREFVPTRQALEAIAKSQAEGAPMFSRAPAGGQTETAEFKRWFGDSKVVDAEGKPLVVYHGSTSGGISNATVQNTFFTPNRDVASGYALDESASRSEGQLVVNPVYIRIENPLVVDAYGAPWMAIPFEGGRMTTDGIAAIAKQRGHDGVLIKNVEDNVNDEELPPADIYITLGKRGQIKSATGNNGQFDPSSPDIRFSFAGASAATADRHALVTAQDRLSAGEDAETVRQETGWFQGKDGKWRFEISDAGAQLAQQVYFAERGKWYPSRFLADARDHGSDTGGTGTLGDVLEHPALFAAYPALRDMPVTAKIRKDQESGAFDGRSITATAENEGRLLSVLLHEIQHGIQNIEGFATGGSIESARAMQADAQSNAFNQAQGAWYESRKRWPSAYKS
ncbi:MAG: hypothetical protein KA195_00180, partial [Burkholderiaceae bacterium]|nr:hypothetical protein [Burkholderiaceae bacterium]